ncbi:hypothetical protein DIPPA_14914 [Diplonema papillatum]|nr:hypothetical protein DIPPA_17959 [Diplonema papillatum]KAJ9466076.1 hypothetical protein DIPPA_14914 [Diplonema papillatum]
MPSTGTVCQEGEIESARGGLHEPSGSARSTAQDESGGDEGGGSVLSSWCTEHVTAENGETPTNSDRERAKPSRGRRSSDFLLALAVNAGAPRDRKLSVDECSSPAASSFAATPLSGATGPFRPPLPSPGGVPASFKRAGSHRSASSAFEPAPPADSETVACGAPENASVGSPLSSLHERFQKPPTPLPAPSVSSHNSGGGTVALEVWDTQPAEDRSVGLGGMPEYPSAVCSEDPLGQQPVLAYEGDAPLTDASTHTVCASGKPPPEN